MEWLAHSQKKYCELCKTPFRFTKLYDQSMPENVPWLLFLRQVAIHTLKGIGTWSRYAIVTFVWLCWLPWTIRQIWRALFWIADGSWLSRQDLEAAVQGYASQLSEGPAIPFSESPSNATATGSTTISISFFSTMFAIVGLLDPQIVLRAIIRTVLQVAIWPTVQGEPVKWDKAFLHAPIPRPPSLLSDFSSITSATRFPILNNALIDVLEGQLICLAIIAAFILVFLIREWVINQQPLLNMPEDEQGENDIPGQNANEPRQAVRRRRRGLRRLGNNNAQLENRPLAPPAPRRRATENNILVQDAPNRPTVPQRAQSLMPALQELETNARAIQDIGDDSVGMPTSTFEALESPPLERGSFDDIGYIRRTIEERSTSTPALTGEASSTIPEVGSREQSPQPTPDTTQAEPISAPSGVLVSNAAPMSNENQFGQSDFNFRSSAQLAEPESINGTVARTTLSDAEDDWESDSKDEPTTTPETSSQNSQQAPAPEALIEAPDQADDTDYQSEPETSRIGSDHVADEEPDTLITRLSKWLWHTDDYLPGEPPLLDTDETEIVADINAEAPFVPVANLPAPNDANNNHPAVAEPAPNVQQGINLNDPHAVDEAEDLEGILELIGMEGPIAGMIQNIIFSVFLITLTLSASVWCPYIWGKITLLFVAHPFSVFVKAPLFLLSKIADFVVDLGLFTLGWTGILLNSITKTIQAATFRVLPRFSKLLDTDLLERFALSLSQNSGARLEQSITKTILGFRPDLPTFSVQSHHVLRVLCRNAKAIGSTAIRSLSSQASHAVHLNLHDVFTMPVTLGASARALPETSRALWIVFRQWHVQLQHELRPLSFSKPDDIDYSLVQWSATEKIFCVVLGYTLFAVAGALYLKVARRALALKGNDKVPGLMADSLRQAGGVMKVIVIIGIEMIVFPLYCGTMLDIALLPLFKGATLQSRLDFFLQSPLTALFIHWFLGTCYMFHFALFVSMCRKIMRKGVLYFIRDPDDPSFHPVRDVLERPVITQLGKIAFSAFVYGSLLVIFLGGVVTGLSKVGDVLPIQWGARDPLMAIPGDIVFYNFMLPVILRKVDLSKRISTAFGWWFRACAAGLRLSDFMFGVDNEEEKKPGTFLWQRFRHVLVHGEPKVKHPMVQYIEDLANRREHLLWFESKEGPVNDECVRKIVGSKPRFKILSLLDDKAQALVEFDENENMTDIMKSVNEDGAKPDSNTHVKQVKDMKVENVELPALRNTKVNESAGTYVRAPAKDSVRIPKGTSIFVRVNEKNDRVDGQEEATSGLHSKTDERFSRIYVPTHFRARISTFIGLVWIFVAIAGLIFTVGPLLVGRLIISAIAGPSLHVNDLYAMTVGIHVFAGSIFTVHAAFTRWVEGKAKVAAFFKNTRQAMPTIFAFARRTAGLIYVTAAVGIVIPLALSLLAELYVNIPVYTWLVGLEADAPSNPLISSTQGATSPVIHLLQTWAMGLLYLRVALRVMTTTPHGNTRAAVAIRGITRKGFLAPDVKLATRALLLPILAACISLLGLPLLAARLAIARSPYLSAEQQTMLYRYSYPVLLSVVVFGYTLKRLRARIESWRVKIRDEVYLIGERLHNFQGQDKAKSLKGKQTPSKGKHKPVELVDQKVEAPVVATHALDTKSGQKPSLAHPKEQLPELTHDQLHDQLGGFEPIQQNASAAVDGSETI